MKYPNKRLAMRSGNGQFRKPTPQDFGIGGICEVCNHLLLRHYNGDENERPLNPAGFSYRCFTCNPLTEEEKAKREEREASMPKERSLMDIIQEIADKRDKEDNE